MGTRGSFVRLSLAVALLAGAIAVGVPSPASAAFACAAPLAGTTIKESIVVPAGTQCHLTNVTVRGGVSVGEGATFDVRESEIRGSVTATGSASLFVYLTTVRGSVTSTAAHAFIDTSDIRGDATVTDAVSPSGTHVIRSTIRGSLTFSRNRTTYENSISTNVIGVNLSCEDNAPPPVNGGTVNSVGGVKSGQCAGL